MFDDSPLTVCVVGGCGRAGLPLAMAFARAGLRVDAFDIDAARVAAVQAGTMPFDEAGADELLPRVIRSGRLCATTDPAAVARAQAVIIIVGTPIDEFLNPSTTALERCVEQIVPHLAPKTLVILRSTVFPGTSEWLARELARRGVTADVAMCPERITEGFALEELGSLPQIIGADDDATAARAESLFGHLAGKMIRTSTKEAELAKLFTNAWRYVKFAVANHFFMVADAAGADYTRLLRAVREDYPRAADLPGPGFAAGPCLLKDTMQLAAFDQSRLMLAQSAMVVNEGLPDYIVRKLDESGGLRGRTVGILGMAFKKESDDPRQSLSYKVRKLLQRAGATVLCTDPYVNEGGLVPLERVLAEADVLVIGAPHDAYRALCADGKRIVDVWGLLGRITV